MLLVQIVPFVRVEGLVGRLFERHTAFLRILWLAEELVDWANVDGKIAQRGVQ